jgi:protein Mpv17
MNCSCRYVFLSVHSRVACVCVVCVLVWHDDVVVVAVHTYIHTYTHTHTCIHTHIYIYIYLPLASYSFYLPTRHTTSSSLPSVRFLQMVIAAILWTVGDLLAQRIQGRQILTGDVDIDRTWRFAAYAFFLFAPIVFLWFRFLEYLFPGQRLLPAVQRVGLDQIVFAPFIISFMFIIMGLLEGKSCEQAHAKVRKDLWDTLLTNWSIWPLAQLINMLLVPPHLRLVYVNTLNIFWTAYLSAKVESDTECGGGDGTIDGPYDPTEDDALIGNHDTDEDEEV